MGDAGIIAEFFVYPGPGRAGQLRDLLAGIADDTIKGHLAAFVEQIDQMPLAGWEELATRTLDLSPAVVPYVGHRAWGENYHRGRFMAELAHLATERGIDRGGELPNHVMVILRLIDTGPVGVEEFSTVVPQAIAGMTDELAAHDPGNSYVHVLHAADRVVRLELGALT